jgi:hypothetical protein
MSQELTYEIDAPPSESVTQKLTLLAPQHVSPAILEFQIEELKEQLRKAESRATIAETQNQIYVSRIKGFERIAAAIAAKADELRATMNLILSPTPSNVRPLKPAA